MPTNANDLRIEPAAVTDATNRLGALATRLDRLLVDEGPHLSVAAPGRDEVSTAAAATLNDVHKAFAESLGRGTAQVRALVTTLNAHTANILNAERDFSN